MDDKSKTTETTHSGSCQCDQVKYTLADGDYRLNICHCKDCQRQSGSAFGLSLIVPFEAFQLTSGKLKSFQLKASSGRTKTCAFCPDCGVRIYNQTTASISVKPGTLDDTSWLGPDAHYWTESKQAWVSPQSNIPIHEPLDQHS